MVKDAYILVVDDVESNTLILQKMIEQMGHETKTALNVPDAIQIIETRLPDLIFTDLSMPGIDGYKFIEILKTNERTKDIPIIIITGLRDVKNVERILESGVVGFIPKPYNRITVGLYVENHLKTRQLEKELDILNKRYNEIVIKHETEIEQVRRGLFEFAAKKSYEREGSIEKNSLISKRVEAIAQALSFTTKYEGHISKDYIDTVTTASYIKDITGVLSKCEDEAVSKNKYISTAQEIIKYIDTDYGNDSSKENNLTKGSRSTTKVASKAGDKIPLSARIARVAEASMTKKREQLEEMAGLELDPYIVDTYLKISRHADV